MGSDAGSIISGNRKGQERIVSNSIKMEKYRSNRPAEKIVILGAYLGLSLMLSYLDSLIPIPIGVPGLKIVLTNLSVLMMLYRTGLPDTIFVRIVRILLSGFLFGNPFSILYSLSGGMASLFLMYGLKRCRCFRLITISMAGGMTHNLGQIILASLVMQSPGLYFYFPILSLGGMAAGFVIGITAVEVLRRLPDQKGVFIS